ncbi:MAG: glycosyl hydrolase, partial [Candidatus Bathyarchaeia archaeon]
MNPEDFKNPGKEYRPSPFWSWNDRLDAEELRWQVREFADKGFGGYFMHSRVGLATSYLSPEWMQCVRACLDEGRNVDVESWLYDEDKWPSGFAGGIVPAKSDEYRARTLVLREIEREDIDSMLKDPSIISVFEVRITASNVIEEFERIIRSSDVKGDGRLFAFSVQVPPRNNWYNGESYVDLLNPKVTEEFLDVTIDAYAENFKEEFGEYMPGIFTDEPNYYHRVRLESVPWTGEFTEYFRKLNGYDITEKIPLLFIDGENCEKVRYDFWKTLTRRFIEAWTIPYSKRCDKYGLKMTGHYLCEDNLVIQTRYIGAAMPHYEYMHLPGIDHLGRNIRDPLTLKQCSSVAHQFGRTRVLCEIFGCSGHSMTFEDQKWIADFHFALGITFLCQHLTLYTQKGDGKRDYPPTISYHQTYWPYYKLINDYFSRAGYLCSQGRFYADILVLHPIGSAWATYSPRSSEDRESRPWRYNDALVRLQDDLLALHWDFDFGDEMILERHGRVEAQEAFLVNESKYRLIIVPPSLTWARRTVDLLLRFLDAGGKVLFVGETPRLIDGEPAKAEWKKVLAHPSALQVAEDRKSIDKAIRKILPRPVSITDEEGDEIGDIYIHHRVDDERHIYFLSNKSRTRKYDAMITFAEKGEITEWNLFDGSVSKVEAVTHQGKTVIYAAFHPAGSHAYVIDTSKPSAPEGLPSEVKMRFEETAV